MIKDCPVLMAKIQGKKNQQPTQNLQIMRSELCEDDPSVNIVTQSATTIGEDKA